MMFAKSYNLEVMCSLHPCGRRDPGCSSYLKQGYQIEYTPNPKVMTYPLL